jgi:hypothetical protein
MSPFFLSKSADFIAILQYAEKGIYKTGSIYFEWIVIDAPHRHNGVRHIPPIPLVG